MKYKDLHLHLSGSTSGRLLFEIIQEAGLKMKSKSYWEFLETITMDRSKINNLDDYLSVLHIIDEAQSSPRAVQMCFYDSFVSSYLSGCEYLELRWNPYKRSQKFKIDLDRLIIAARAGYERAKSIFGISGGMILCLGRDVSEEANEGIFKKAIQYNGKGVLGVDVAGSESKELQEDFARYFSIANTMGMVTTIHTGETFHDGTEDELATVIEKYKPKRLGHGIQIHRFPSLMKKAAKQNIHFEICPTSNLTTKAVDSKEELSKILKVFQKNGLNYSINTDATFALGTNIQKEHELHEELMEL